MTKQNDTQLGAEDLRWLLAVILGITVGLGVALARLMIHFGITSIVVRNAILFPATYLFFFVVVYFWRKRTDLPAQYSDAASLAMEAQQNAAPGTSDDQQPRKTKWWDYLYFDFGEATLIILAVVAFIAIAIWVFGEAPAILSEAFFDVGLSAGIAGALRKRRGSPWYVGLFKKTFLMFLCFYVSSILLLIFFHVTCPEQLTLLKILRECW